MSRTETALVTKSGSSRSAISTRFKTPIDPRNKTLVLQYEMRPQMAFTCSGAYIKLFTDPKFNPESLTNSTPYTIMFGPDRCSQSNRIHFIFNHLHPKRLQYLQKSLKNPPEAPIDLYTHLYTLIVRPNNTFSILVDNAEVRNGSLFFDFEPPLLEPRDLPDPADSKPTDWVDVPYVADMSDRKPADWDDRKEIPDPADPASVIPNPEYRGEWRQKLKPNPDYKGEWKPRRVPNPFYFMDMHPSDFRPFTAIGFEIWAVNRELAFSNILMAHDEAAVKKYNVENFLIRKRVQLEEDQNGEEDVVRRKLGFAEALRDAYREIRWAFLGLWDDYAFHLTLVFLLVVLVLVLCCVKSRRKKKTQ
jgi:calnexin